MSKLDKTRKKGTNTLIALAVIAIAVYFGFSIESIEGPQVGAQRSVHRLGGLLESPLREIDRGSVLRPHQEESQRGRTVLLEHVPDGEEVPQRLGHLFGVHVDEAVVHPVARKRGAPLTVRATGGLGLGKFVLVVGEDQVPSPPVNVDTASEQGLNHGAALDVPAWPTRPPRAVPARFILLRGFP